jgi:hypothetical protein
MLLPAFIVIADRFGLGLGSPARAEVSVILFLRNESCRNAELTPSQKCFGEFQAFSRAKEALNGMQQVICL